MAEYHIISYIEQASKHEASFGNAKRHKPFSFLEVKLSKLTHRHAPTSMPDSGADIAALQVLEELGGLELDAPVANLKNQDERMDPSTTHAAWLSSIRFGITE